MSVTWFVFFIIIFIIIIIIIIIIAKCAGSWLSQNAIVSGFEEGGGAGVWEGQRRRRRRWWGWWWSWNENDDHGDVSVNGYHHDEEIVSNPTCNNKIFLFQIENISSEQLQQVKMIISYFPSSLWSSAISSPSSSPTSTGAEHNHRQLPAREGSKTAGRQRRSKSRKRMFHHLGLEPHIVVLILQRDIKRNSINCLGLSWWQCRHLGWQLPTNKLWWRCPWWWCQPVGRCLIHKNEQRLFRRNQVNILWGHNYQQPRTPSRTTFLPRGLLSGNHSIKLIFRFWLK